MRTRMAAVPIPDLTPEQTTKIVDYLAAHMGPLQPYDPNSRLPTALQQGKGLHYRVVTYDLADRYAEPHDVAADPLGNAWVGERAGRVGRFDPRTLEFVEFKTPPGPAAENRQSLGNPQIDARGIMWVPDGPNNRWLSFDTKTEKFQEWEAPTPFSAPYDVALDKNGYAWTGSMSSDRVLRLDPKSGQYTEYLMPRFTNIRRVFVDNSGPKPVLWIGNNHGASIVKVEPLDE